MISLSGGGTFIKGREILKQVLAEKEAFDSGTKMKKKGFIFKADFEKAHDYIIEGFFLGARSSEFW